MKCQKCQAENSEDSKFCHECGVKLVKVCPQCGSECLLGDKFCSKCGKNLSLPPEPSIKEFTADEKLEIIKRYLPKALTEKVLAQRDKIEGERKQVTVMFCDMVGFTPLSERLGPEEAYSIMDRVYEILIHKVHDYEGTVNEMTGDGIMALFGAPITLEDAPQRAIRSAYAIHREISRFNDRVEQERGDSLAIKMRIGIHTGPVVVGTLGNDLRVEFKAVGDTVNLASRMEGFAEPGTSYVTEDTFKLTEGLFRFEALGEQEVKGKEEPIKVYRVIAPSSRRTRFDTSAERGLTSFVGRERELELLLDGFERAKGGRGQAFSITAEAGVGKSRILYEFRKAVANENVTFLEGKCLSYSRGVAYHPVTDILKATFEVNGSDSDVAKREKVAGGLQTLGVDEASTLPYVLELLSAKDSGIDQIPLSPEAKKVRIQETLKRIVLKGSEKRPLILAIEDLHWIDESSEESLKDLLDSISGARVLLLLTYRPEFVHTWGGKSYHSQVNLNRLSNRESLTMVYNLLGTEGVARELEDFILERTEGVPFFIEEFVKSLKDLKVLEKKDNVFIALKDLHDVSIPSTIQDVIMARVDSLPDAVKKILQTGSVVGREFSYELIKEVAGLPEKELLSHLSILKDSELVFERGIYPQSTYIFKHALTQDAAYGSLLKSTCQKYHKKVAQALEERFPSTVETQPERLGYHYTEAGLLEQAIPYWQRAGDIDMKRSAHTAAIGHYTRGLELLEKLSQKPERVAIELALQTALGTALMPVRGFGAPEVKQSLDRARELSQQVGDTAQLLTVLHGLWIYYLVRAELKTSYRLADQMLNIAQQVQDPAALLEAHHDLGSNFYWAGEYTSARTHYEQSIDLYNSQPKSSRILIPGREDAATVCYSQDSEILWILGYPEQAIKSIHTALDLAQELSQVYDTAFVQCFASFTYLMLKETKQAQEYGEIAVDISEEHGFTLWIAASKVYLGSALTVLGQGERGISMICQGIDTCHEAGTDVTLPHMFVILADAYGRAGELEKGFASLADAETMMEKTGARFYEEELHRVKGELLLQQDNPDEEKIETEFRTAVDIARRKQAKSLELRATLSLCKLLKKKGKKEEAHKLLYEIYGWFTEGFDTTDLITAKALLKELTCL